MAGSPSMDKCLTSDIHFISLASFDLRCFAGDELLLLAELSGHFRGVYLHDQSVVPTIDKLLFNESLSSRKQTYCNWESSNGRLGKSNSAEVCARRDIEVGSEYFVGDCTNRKLSGTKKWLRSVKSNLVSMAAKRPVRQCSSAVSCRTIGGRVGCSSQDEWHALDRSRGSDTVMWTGWEPWGFPKRARELKLSKQTTDGAVEGPFVTSDLIHSHSKQTSGCKAESSSSKKLNQTVHVCESLEEVARRKRRKRLASDPLHFPSKRTLDCKAERSSSRKLNQTVHVCESLEEVARRKRRKRIARANSAAGSLEEARFLKAMKRNVPGRRLIDRRFEQARMVDLLSHMKGRWSCNRKTRKVVNAVGFPEGWTVHVGLSHKDGRFQFEYSDWRSPEGNLWPSFEGASSFLLSILGYDSAAEIKPIAKSSQARHSDKLVSFTKAGGICGANFSKVSSAIMRLYFSSDHLPLPMNGLDETDARKKIVNDISKTKLDQSLEYMDGVLNMVPFATKGKVDREVLSTAKVLHSWQAGCKVLGGPVVVGLMEKYCSEHTRDPFDSFNKTSIREVGKDVDFCSTTCGVKCRYAFGASCNRTALCPSCGMTFSTLLELRLHFRKAKHVRRFYCGVCRGYFPSMTSLLGHLLETGHPGLTKTGSNSARSKVEGSRRLMSLSGSGMIGIVWGLLSHSYKRSDSQEDYPTVLQFPPSSATFREASDELQEKV